MNEPDYKRVSLMSILAFSTAAVATASFRALPFVIFAAAAIVTAAAGSEN
ncbi:MAG: hypothetical protein R3C49_17585 [Planctomycetaceae bacterium]